jgi:hypothetical protein
VTVGGVSSSIPATPFRWERRAVATLHRWEEAAETDYLEGAHDGYAHLAPPATHQRAILFVRNRFWIIRDTVVSGSAHGFEVRWQAGPDVTAAQVRTGAVRLTDGVGAGLVLVASAGALEIEEGWSSPVFGKRVRAPACACRMPRNSGDVVVTVLVPCCAGEEPTVEFSGSIAMVTMVTMGSWQYSVGFAEGPLRLVRT